MKTSSLTIRRAQIRVFAFLAVACCALQGCTRSIVAGEHETAFADTSETAALDFWHTLPGQSAVTNAQGLHGILLFADGTDATGSYEARVAELKSRGWVIESFDEPANMAMSRGTMAKALAHAMDIKGGVMMQLTNGSPRYATRELLYLAIMPPGTDQQIISGLDYVGVISKSQDYVMLRSARDSERAMKDEPAADDPAQPAAPTK